MTTIRLFQPNDRAALIELFGRAGADSPSGELWGDGESERAVYLDPYVEHCSESLYLAERDGRLVGYLTGCRDSASMPSEDELFSRAISSPRVMLRPRAIRFFARAMMDTAGAKRRGEPVSAGGLDDARWPAHLHINLAPEARGTGAAAGLMSAWLEQLDQVGSPGCFLQTLVENRRAVRFFEKSGFTSYGPTPLVPGIRYQGRRMHQLTMVR